MYRQFAWVQKEDGFVPDGSETTMACDGSGVARKLALTYSEFLHHDYSFSMPVTDLLFSGKTKYQDVKILSTKHFGKCLIMDNHMQSAQSDEAVYHESLVHPALLSHPNPMSVFIGGGGEGASAREVLRHKSVKKVVMVDIDEQAVKMCREQLKEWNTGVFEDPRLELHYGDADEYLRRTKGIFDVIIMDISDPLEAGPGWKLYTKEFYERIKMENLSQPYGILCTQSTACSVNLITECFTTINKTLRTVFDTVRPYRVNIPSFGCPWGFHLCCEQKRFMLSNDPERIDSLTEERLGKEQADGLIHYNGECHTHMFALSKHERRACEEETRELTELNPIFMN